MAQLDWHDCCDCGGSFAEGFTGEYTVRRVPDGEWLLSWESDLVDSYDSPDAAQTHAQHMEDQLRELVKQMCSVNHQRRSRTP